MYLISDREVSMEGLHFAQVKAQELSWRAGTDGWTWLDAARAELVAAIEAATQLAARRSSSERADGDDAAQSENSPSANAA